MVYEFWPYQWRKTSLEYPSSNALSSLLLLGTATLVHTVIPSQGSSGFLSEWVKYAATFAACWYWSLPRRQQFITLWKYFYMLHAEKITTSAVVELRHMKKPGRTPQWILKKEEDLCPVLQANMAPLPSNQEVKIWTVRLLFWDPCLQLLWGGDSPWEYW